MTLPLNYPDTATFVRVRSSGYANNKIPEQQVDVPVIFVQNTDFRRGNSQDAVDSDAICYPDFNNSFIQENFNRLEGMYIIMPLYGASDAESWFKIESVTVHRDHLLNNTIDNIELALKKSRPIPMVS